MLFLLTGERGAALSDYIKSDDVIELERISKSTRRVDMWCFPLRSLLLAINYTKRIDYFTLDIEGAEMAVLDSLPWEKLEFGVIQVIFHMEKLFTH